MKKNKRIYIVEIILLIFIIMFKMFFLKQQYYLWAASGLFAVMALILYLWFGFVKDNNYFKKSTIRVTIIILLLYFITIFCFGLFMGFGYSKFDKNPLVLLNNVAPYILFIVFAELSRYMILKKDPSKIQKIILTIEFIILDIIIGINGIVINSYSGLFITCSTIILPILANEWLYTYISDNVSFVPVIIYHIIIEIYAFVFPFLPAIGNYFISVFGCVLPYMLYLQIRGNLKYKEKYGKRAKRTLIRYIVALIITMLAVLIALTSGVFKYMLVAIVSNSMDPTYSRGDAIIIEKKDASKIKEGDILAFNTGIGIVTHRVLEITEKDGIYTYITKGDNNIVPDDVEIHNDDVIGTVNYILKYAGYPTVWVSGIFERN